MDSNLIVYDKVDFQNKLWKNDVMGLVIFWATQKMMLYERRFESKMKELMDAINSSSTLIVLFLENRNYEMYFERAMAWAWLFL